MADPALAPVSAWAGLFRPQANPGSRVILQPIDTMQIASLAVRRGQEAGFSQALQKTWCLDPLGKNRRAASNALALIWSGPDNFLALSTTGTDLEAALHTHLGAYAHITNQTDGKAVIRVSGPGAREILAKMLPIDLHPAVFGAGNAAITTAGQIGVTIWQLDARPTYELAVSRSTTGSFGRWLRASAEPVGLDIVAG